MSETISTLQRKLGTAAELLAVVRTMKAMAAASIGQYNQAVAALELYDRTVQLGLALCLRRHETAPWPLRASATSPASVGAIVFGSDQGMVGQFNDVMHQHVIAKLASLGGRKVVWAVGERIAALFAESGMPSGQHFSLPVSTAGIAALVGKILVELGTSLVSRAGAEVFVFHHRPLNTGGFEPVCQRLLPLDALWLAKLAAMPWPGKQVPQLIGSRPLMLAAYINEYLFVAISRACAESLASESASRLIAMQRAETNIDQLHDELQLSFQRLRQSDIDEELFDLVCGFEAISKR